MGSLISFGENTRIFFDAFLLRQRQVTHITERLKHSLAKPNPTTIKEFSFGFSIVET